MLHLFTHSLAVITIPVGLTPIILYSSEAFSDCALVIFTWRSPLKHLLLRRYLLLAPNLCLSWLQLNLSQLNRSVFLRSGSLNIFIPIQLTIAKLTNLIRCRHLNNQVLPGQGPSLVSRAYPCIWLDRCQTSGRTSFGGRGFQAPRRSSLSFHWSSHSGRQGSGGSHSGRR